MIVVSVLIIASMIGSVFIYVATQTTPAAQPVQPAPIIP